jgi:Mor family transcriptional regulator
MSRGYALEAIYHDVVCVLKESSAADPGDTAKAIIERIQKSLGGGDCYIPALSVDARNANIIAEFRGNNHADICNRHKISLRTLYRIIGNK